MFLRMFFVLFIGISVIQPSFGQVPQTDVSKINIDNLSDEQVAQLMARASLSGLSDEEMARKATEMGFSQDQIAKLRARASKLPAEKGTGTGEDGAYNRGPGKTTAERFNPRDFITEPKSKIFGSEFFSNQNLTFEPNLNIATPDNYIIGPGDKLIIDIYGYSEIQHKVEVSPDGIIRIPSVGPVFVSGLSIEEAKVRIRRHLATVYSGINTGKTFFQLVLGQIRSIRVTMIGEVKHPASYTLPSLATIANALYLSGGPTQNGSLRKIDLVRNGEKIMTFDFYDFLLRGDLSKNIMLRDQDVIRVNSYTKRVELAGAVKRQAIFEVKEDEKLSDVIGFSGGFADTANTDLITAYRVAGREREILNVTASGIGAFELKSGDSIFVNGILKRFKNRVSIAGAVYYPGNYSLSQAASLKDLLGFAQVREGAFRERALVRRLLEDNTPSTLNFNVNDIMSGKGNFSLQREDSVYIYSVTDLRQQYTVSVNGEVNLPGVFGYADSMKLQDAILAAGGFKDGASNKRIEISRRIRSSDSTKVEADSLRYAIVDILDMNIDYTPMSGFRNYSLQPFDIISVRKSPTYKEQVTVTIEGEVNYPGDYTIQSRTERLSDLVRRAGGLKSQAYPEGAVLSRRTFESIKDSSLLTSKLRLLDRRTSDTSQVKRNSNVQALADQQKPVGIRLKSAMENPGSLYDISLEEGDVLKIPKYLQTVQTFGSVNVNQKIIFRPGMTLDDAVRESGGYTKDAIRRRSYVVQANGEIRSVSKFLFFAFYPKLTPGAEVYVPSKGNVKPLSTAELIGISSSIAGLGAIVISLISLLKK